MADEVQEFSCLLNVMFITLPCEQVILCFYRVTKCIKNKVSQTILNFQVAVFVEVGRTDKNLQLLLSILKIFQNIWILVVLPLHLMLSKSLTRNMTDKVYYDSLLQREDLPKI